MAEKSVALRKQQEHLMFANVQITDYNRKQEIARSYALANVGSENQPCSRDMVAMYSFDFAQQAPYPSNPDQPGAIYFKVPRKCMIFGVNNEAINRQVNYLIDEVVSTGKGANTVVSYLHHFLRYMDMGKQC